MAQQIIFHKSKRKLFKGFGDGMRAPFAAFAFIKGRKGYVKFFIIPFLLNIVLLAAIFYLTFTWLYPTIKTVLPQGEEWYILLIRSLTSSLLFFVTVISAIFLYSISGMVISFLFLDPLSSKVEKELLISSSDKLTLRKVFSDLALTITTIFKMILLLILFNGAIFALNFIPIAGNLLFSIFSFLSLIFFFGAPFIEMPLDRRTVNFKSKLKLLLHYRYIIMGLGFSFMVLSIIPVIGFLSHSLGAVGGSILFSEKIHPEVEFVQK
ncbi:MAG: EI24 domain-containing protein [Spirochaetes bacterium]|nr:EI24 domain-containing protein [Spirochaetota bacterium]